MNISRGIAAICAATLTFTVVPAQAAQAPSLAPITRATLAGELLLASGRTTDGSESLSVTLRTDDGELVALDPDALPAELTQAAPGSQVEVQVEVPAPARAALADVAPTDLLDGSATEEIAAALEGPTEVRVVDATVPQDAIVDLGARYAESETADASGGAALAPARTHQAYVVLVDDTKATGEYTEATAKDALARGAAYWKRESGGRMAGLAVKQVATHKTSDVCASVKTGAGIENLWATVAAKHYKNVAFGHEGSRHLVVMLPRGCDAVVGWTGYARINLDLSSGGQMMFIFGDTHTIAHEMGHNFGLGHSNLLSDGLVEEYMGVHSVQGFSFYKDDAMRDAYAPPALDVAYLDVLDVAAPGTVTRGTPNGTTTLAPVTASSGTRGLVFSDTEGTIYFAEYRDGRGRDAEAMYGTPEAGPWFGFDPTVGVRVYALTYDAGYELLTLGSSGGGFWRTAFVPGGSVKTLDGRFTVTVPAISGGKATVKISGVKPTTTSVKVAKAVHGKKTTVKIQVKGVDVMGGVVTAKVGKRRLGTAEVTPDGVATFRLPAALAAGRHKVVASFSGNATVGSSLGSRKVTVAKGKVAVKLTKAKNLKRGKKATLAVRVTGTSATAPTGKITVKVGSKTVSKTVKLKKRKGQWTASVRTTRLPRGVVRVVYAPSGDAKKNLVKGSYSTGKRVR